jgi:MoaA/NifB/PqqE/SkfB family radical SAM enzyme
MYKVAHRNRDDSIHVEWNLGKRCNFDCSYCPAAIHDNTSEHTDIEILKATVDKLMTLGKPVQLSFTGGEPCVHPKFSELVMYAKHVGIQKISVTTNGSRKAVWYENLPVDQYVFSIHMEHDPMRILNTIVNVHMNNPKIYLVAQIMALHSHMKTVKVVADACKAHGISYNIRRIRWTEGDHNIFDDMRYDADDYKWILENSSTVYANCVVDDDHNQLYHANDIIKLHMNKYKDWKCNAGLESLMINWDGEVHRATCRVGGSLGNIYEGSFTIPTEPIICTRDYCTCAADIPLTKVLVNKVSGVQ